jgi:uncharacterized protein (TIGR02145 family)
MRTIKRIAGATLMVSGFSILTGMIANSLSPVEAQTGQVQINAAVSTGSLALTIDNSGPCSSFDTTNQVLTIETMAGGITSNCLTVTANGTNPNGYTLTIDGPDSGNLVLGNQTLSSTNGSMGTPATLTSGLTTGSWGFAIPAEQNNGFSWGFDNLATYTNPANGFNNPTNTNNTAKFASVPTSATPFATTDAINSTPDTYNMFFGVSAGAGIATGTYTGVVTITGFGNATPLPQAIQEITIGTCPTDRTMVMDARDNKTYWIQKTLDGQCWMQTNLAYAGGGNNAFGDVKTLVQSVSGVNIGVGQACRGDNATLNTFGQGCFWTPDDANLSVFPTEPSTATDGGMNVATRQFGYLYNWCAAMGNQPEACQTSTFIQPNQSVSICPAGWRLPIDQPTTGEFTALNTAINGGSTNPAGLFSNGLFMSGGMFESGTHDYIGEWGMYWSSTSLYAGGALSLGIFDTTYVDTAEGSAVKGSGGSIRCVVDTALTQPTISSISPNTGSTAGGTTITITGTNFIDVQSVTIDGNLCTDLNVQSTTQLACVTPAGSAGGQDVQVTTSEGTVMRQQGFLYLEPGAPLLMQNITVANCPTTRTLAMDARDNRTYWVRKIGNLCWMETNLAYAGGGILTFGDTMSITQGILGVNTNAGQVCRGDFNSLDDFRRSCFWTPTGANPTTNPAQPSTSTTGTGQHGYLYNWCAAMGNQSSACSVVDGNQPNQSVNDGINVFNICPRGWRLPTGGWGTDEFTALNTAINGGVNDTDTGLLSNGLFMRSGGFNNGSFWGAGIDGTYWTSTVDADAAAQRFVFRSDDVIGSIDTGKSLGLSVRCVSP